MTVVEWLIDELNEIKSSSTGMNGEIRFLEKEFTEALEQAKEMEKQQIEDAFYQRDLDEFGDEVEFEQYYNETFKAE